MAYPATAGTSKIIALIVSCLALCEGRAVLHTTGGSSGIAARDDGGLVSTVLFASAFAPEALERATEARLVQVFLAAACGVLLQSSNYLVVSTHESFWLRL